MAVPAVVSGVLLG